MNTTSILDRIKTQPVLFTLLAVYHLVMLVWMLYDFAGVLNTFTTLGSVVVMTLYTVLWYFIFLQYRWAAIAYISLTAINLLLQFLTKSHSPWKNVSDAFFPYDLIFCFFLLFYYKRFH